MEIIANRSQLFSPQYIVKNEQKSQTLIIKNAQWRDVGVYKCIASINGIIIEAETRLNVLSESYKTNLMPMHVVCYLFAQFL